MRRICFFLLALGAHCAALASPTNEWSSAPCSSVALGPGPALSHLQRIFLIGAPDYTIQYKFFADPACVEPLYSMVFKGSSEVTGVSPVVARAKEVTVRIERLLFTLDSPRGAVAARACADGQFEVGVQRDVTASGCLHIAPKATCGVDYELVGLEQDVLTPGLRSANMCTPAGRPTSLQTAGARWIGQFP